MAIEPVIGARMTEFSFPYVSVASSGGEYFELSFAESEDSDRSYFLLQRQFESYDGGFFYLESHETKLCGHFKIRRARSSRGILFVSRWRANRPRRFRSDFKPAVFDTTNSNVFSRL